MSYRYASILLIDSCVLSVTIKSTIFCISLLSISVDILAYTRGGMSPFSQGMPGMAMARGRGSDRGVGADMSKFMRPTRSDASSLQGAIPHIISPLDTAELAEIKQCVCALKNLIEHCACSQTDMIINQVALQHADIINIIMSVIETKFDAIESRIDAIDASIVTLLEAILVQLQD
jgi:hypothetical protein